IPILVESAQWQNLINLTLPNILNAALLQLVPDAGSLTNSKTFQLLIREQLLVPIFDGFDELCLHPNSDYSPASVLTPTDSPPPPSCPGFSRASTSFGKMDCRVKPGNDGRGAA